MLIKDSKRFITKYTYKLNKNKYSKQGDFKWKITIYK